MTKKQKLNKIYKQLIHRLVVRESARPAFVFGSQRSGTNMLMDVLKKHPATDCYDETDSEAFDNYVLRDTKVVDRLVSDSRARLAVFKAITSSQHAANLLKRFSSGKAVWIYRDYNDVVNSALRRFTEHRKYLGYILHDPVRAGWRREKPDTGKYGIDPGVLRTRGGRCQFPGADMVFKKYFILSTGSAVQQPGDAGELRTDGIGSKWVI